MGWKNGLGIYRDRNNKIQYFGEWKNDEFNGIGGAIYYDNDSIYLGEFLNDKEHG
jgi:hypothetical protein